MKIITLIKLNILHYTFHQLSKNGAVSSTYL